MQILRPILLLALLLLSIAPAIGAEIRNIRIGSHEGHGRVVVELDQPAPYRIANASGPGQLILLEMGEIDRTVYSVGGSNPFIPGTRVERNAADRKVGLHIRTAGPARVQEFTLNDPSRIVLDIIPLRDGAQPTIVASAPPTAPAPPSASSPPPPSQAAAPVARRDPPITAPAPAPVSRPASVAPQQSSSSGGRWVRRIIIDPGHGGHHKGGVGIINGRQVYEKDLAIAVAEKLERHFQRDPRFEVRLTRREDVYVGLYERTVRASQLEGDLFISIHANAVEGKAAQQRARGFEIWTWNRTANRSAAAKAIERLENDDPGMTRENNRILTSMMMDALESQALISRRVAQAVHSRAIQHPYLKRHDRGIDSARFKVLEIYDMPSILMELGFMTHPEEVKMLFDPSFQDDWALIMYEGIIRYYEQSDPTFPRARPSMVAAR